MSDQVKRHQRLCASVVTAAAASTAKEGSYKQQTKGRLYMVCILRSSIREMAFTIRCARPLQTAIIVTLWRPLSIEGTLLGIEFSRFTLEYPKKIGVGYHSEKKRHVTSYLGEKGNKLTFVINDIFFSALIFGFVKPEENAYLFQKVRKWERKGERIWESIHWSLTQKTHTYFFPQSLESTAQIGAQLTRSIKWRLIVKKTYS